MIDLTRSRALRSGAAAAFKDAGGVLGTIIADPRADAILFMGIAHGGAVSLPVTGAEQLQRKHDPAKIIQLVKTRLGQLKLLQEKTRDADSGDDDKPRPKRNPASDAHRGQRVRQAAEGGGEPEGPAELPGQDRP